MMFYFQKVSQRCCTLLFVCGVVTAVTRLDAAAHSQSDEELYDQAVAYYNAGDWIAAVEYIWAVIQRNPPMSPTVNQALYDAILDAEGKLQEALGMAAKCAKKQKAADAGVVGRGDERGNVYLPPDLSNP